MISCKSINNFYRNGRTLMQSFIFNWVVEVNCNNCEKYFWTQSKSVNCKIYIVYFYSCTFVLSLVEILVSHKIVRCIYLNTSKVLKIKIFWGPVYLSSAKDPWKKWNINYQYFYLQRFIVLQNNSNEPAGLTKAAVNFYSYSALSIFGTSSFFGITL